MSAIPSFKRTKAAPKAQNDNMVYSPLLNRFVERTSQAQAPVGRVDMMKDLYRKAAKAKASRPWLPRRGGADRFDRFLNMVTWSASGYRIAVVQGEIQVQ